MQFLNLKKLTLRLVVILLFIELLNTFYIYAELEKITVQNRMDRLKSDAYKAISLDGSPMFKETLKDSWHTYTGLVDSGDFELINSTASAEELASSQKSIVPNTLISSMLKEGKNELVYTYENGFDSISAYVAVVERGGKVYVGVAESLDGANVLFSENLHRAIFQTSLALGVTVLFFMILYVWFGRVKESVGARFDALERELKDSKNRAEFIEKNSKSLYVAIDNLDKIKEVGSGFYALLGFREGDIVGRAITDIFYSKDDFKLFLYEYKNNGKNSLDEVSIKNRYGESGTIVGLRCEQRTVDGESFIYLFLEDETEIRAVSDRLSKLYSEMNEKIRKSVAYSRSILDSEPNIIWVQEKDRVVDANKSFFEMFCNSKRDINEFNNIHSSVFSVFDKVDKADFIYEFERKDTLAHLLAYRHKTHKAQISKNGRKYIFKVSANYLMGDDDNFLNDIFIVILTDITEGELLKEHEISLAKTSTIGRLAAGITHEINTPLTYMKGSFELMKMELEEEAPDKKYIDELIVTLEEGVNRIENIVKSMRELNVKSTDNLEKVAIIDSLKTAVNMIQVRSKYLSPIYIQGKLFSLETDFGGEFYAFANKQKIEQVWIVLLNNALDEFIGSDIEFENRVIEIAIDKDDYFVNISFKDNAGPIPSTIIDKIFEPMFSTKTSSGMGLGLSITRKILDDIKGYIKAYNVENCAVFDVSLPRIK